MLVSLWLPLRPYGRRKNPLLHTQAGGLGGGQEGGSGFQAARDKWCFRPTRGGRSISRQKRQDSWGKRGDRLAPSL